MKASTALLSLVLCATACTAKNSGYEKQLARLDEKVLILQHERDRLEERIAVLEAERDAAPARAPVPGTLERPPLKVVQLEPPAESAEGPKAPPEVASSEAGPAVSGSSSSVAGAAEGAERVLIHGTGTELQHSPVSGAE